MWKSSTVGTWPAVTPVPESYTTVVCSYCRHNTVVSVKLFNKEKFNTSLERLKDSVCTPDQMQCDQRCPLLHLWPHLIFSVHSYTHLGYTTWDPYQVIYYMKGNEESCTTNFFILSAWCPRISQWRLMVWQNRTRITISLYSQVFTAYRS